MAASSSSLFLEASMAASSSPSLSVSSGSSIYASSSSPSLSSLFSQGPYPLPRRGKIKWVIFASIFASIARLLGGNTLQNDSNSQEAAGSSAHMSDFKMDLEGGSFGALCEELTGVDESVGIGHTREPLSLPRSFHEGMPVKG